MIPASLMLMLMALGLPSSGIPPRNRVVLASTSVGLKRKRDDDEDFESTVMASTPIWCYFQQPRVPPRRKKKYYRLQRNRPKTAEDVKQRETDDHFRAYFRYTKAEFDLLCVALDIPEWFKVHRG